MDQETRSEKFKRLAKGRVEQVADSLRKLSNLASPNYDYSDEEVDQLFRYIDGRVKEAKQKFASSDKRGIPIFRWPAQAKSANSASRARERASR